MSNKLDKVISDLEDVHTSVEEVQAGVADKSELDGAEETLERLTDALEDLEENDEDDKD